MSRSSKTRQMSSFVSQLTGSRWSYGKCCLLLLIVAWQYSIFNCHLPQEPIIDARREFVVVGNSTGQQMNPIIRFRVSFEAKVLGDRESSRSNIFQFNKIPNTISSLWSKSNPAGRSLSFADGTDKIGEMAVENKSIVLCGQSPDICARGNHVKELLKKRAKFRADEALRKKKTVRMLLDRRVQSLHESNGLDISEALSSCPSCVQVNASNLADVKVHLLRLPPDITEGREAPTGTYAIVNLEAHSYIYMPVAMPQLMLASFHLESDLVITYGYVMNRLRSLCELDLSEPGRPRCVSPSRRNLYFAPWCADRHGGDFHACAFDVMPYLTRRALQFPSPSPSLWSSPSPGSPSFIKGFAATWMTQKCGRHNEYLARLMKVVPVDSMGWCLRNRDEMTHPGLRLAESSGMWWGGGGGGGAEAATPSDRKVLLASSYRFLVSLENSVQEDYVTEKFFEGFLADTVLVYLGAPNARRYAPAPHSYVDALDFAGPEQLGAFLRQLDRNEAEYQSYLAWKRQRPLRLAPGFLAAVGGDAMQRGPGSTLCRICGLARGDTGG